jgi:hypothetical protein
MQIEIVKANEEEQFIELAVGDKVSIILNAGFIEEKFEITPFIDKNDDGTEHEAGLRITAKGWSWPKPYEAEAFKKGGAVYISCRPIRGEEKESEM